MTCFLLAVLPLILLWGCMIFCIFLFNEGIMPNEHLFVSLVLVFICISFLINYIFLWKDNKYLFYMKKFKSKKNRCKDKMHKFINCRCAVFHSYC